IPGTLPIRLTTIRSLLFPVRTLMALPIVMFSKLTLFTSVILSPTQSPACSVYINQRMPCSEPPRTLKPSFPSLLFSTVMALIASLSSLLAVKGT
uniref:Uncharacterized protein n=1 Tax=Naja naja TaxID=35670 RepID=A0A8C6Y194_NAJNA